MIACGADAAKGDLLGDCGLTPDMYYIMTKSVIETIGVDTPLVTVLEGGYNLPVLADCLQAVNLAMLDEPFDKFVPASKNNVVDSNKDDTNLPMSREHRLSLSRFWSPEEKSVLEGVRMNHPEKGLAKRAMASIHRAARALAFSQSRQGAYNCIQRPMGYVCCRDLCQTARFRRLRMLDFDRCPSHPFKKPRLNIPMQLDVENNSE